MRRAIVIVAVVVAAFFVLGIRVVIEGRRALAAGDAWLEQGRPAEAIRAYESAARWYLPGGDHVERAYKKLRELASQPPDAQQLAAWRAIRRAARATRTLWQPHADDLAAADAAIAKLSAAAPGAATIEVPWHAERLARDVRPSIGGSVLAAFGVLLWLGGAAVLVGRGLAARRWGIGAGLASVAGVLCWIVGLYNG